MDSATQKPPAKTPATPPVKPPTLSARRRYNTALPAALLQEISELDVKVEQPVVSDLGPNALKTTVLIEIRGAEGTVYEREFPLLLEGALDQEEARPSVNTYLSFVTEVARHLRLGYLKHVTKRLQEADTPKAKELAVSINNLPVPPGENISQLMLTDVPLPASLSSSKVIAADELE